MIERRLSSARTAFPALLTAASCPLELSCGVLIVGRGRRRRAKHDQRESSRDRRETCFLPGSDMGHGLLAVFHPSATETSRSPMASQESVSAGPSSASRA
jgi:hypothetical protein